jgi:thiosulfate/3-mercaptopyruvate sulfurtransferase
VVASSDPDPRGASLGNARLVETTTITGDTMNIHRVLSLPAAIAVALLAFVSDAHAAQRSPRTLAPIVSTGWLHANLDAPQLVVLDVRPEAAYVEGHVPGAIGVPFVVPFSAWITMRDGLLLEVPDQADLFATIGSLGITEDSWVVVVSGPNPGEPPGYGLSAATRVADTLIYAGLRDVAILDGGHGRWVSDGFPTTTALPAVQPVVYAGQVNGSMFVSKSYVQQRQWLAVLVDARDADVYFGTTVEPFAPVAGHIPSARALPTPWIWLEDGTYRDDETLAEMALGVVGPNKYREVIVYCGVGGYASTSWFVLTQVLGYRNVKLYDGSAQDWVSTNEMVRFRWQ